MPKSVTTHKSIVFVLEFAISAARVLVLMTRNGITQMGGWFVDGIGFGLAKNYRQVLTGNITRTDSARFCPDQASA